MPYLGLSSSEEQSSYANVFEEFDKRSRVLSFEANGEEHKIDRSLAQHNKKAESPGLAEGGLASFRLNFVNAPNQQA